MKRLILTALTVTFLPKLALAQGTISFGSSNPYQYIVSGNGIPAVGVQATLWWSPDNVAAYVQLGDSITTGATGYILPEVRTTGPETPPGGIAWFQVRAIDGVSWGQSTSFQNVTGNPNGTPPTPPASLDGWTDPIIIPEPSTVALVSLGAAALLLFSLRK